MYYCKVSDFVIREESIFFESGAVSPSDRIFINTKVRDFEQYNDKEEIQSTIIIVKGVDKNYLDIMTPNTNCIGGVYKITSYDEDMYVFEIFVDDVDFDKTKEILKTTSGNTECNLQIYVHLHKYHDFNSDVVLPITHFSIAPNIPGISSVLMGNTPWKWNLVIPPGYLYL